MSRLTALSCYHHADHRVCLRSPSFKGRKKSSLSHDAANLLGSPQRVTNVQKGTCSETQQPKQWQHLLRLISRLQEDSLQSTTTVLRRDR